jgi:hypothetical protein
MRNTILVMAGLVVMQLGVTRLSADDQVANVNRTTPAELATLRDFTSMEVEGDFILDVVRDTGYSVAFTPADANEGRFYATVRNNTLRLGGFQNAAGGRVRVTMPELRKLNAGRVKKLTVTGFDGASVLLEVDTIPQVTLRSNAVQQWQIRADHVDELQIDRASMGAGKVDLAGRITLSVID